MEQKHSYRFDEETGILYKEYFGNISVEDIIESWNTAIANNQIPEATRGFLLDYRKANFKMNVDDYTKIAEYYSQNLHVFANQRIAIVTENPNDIVIPVLVRSLDKGYESRPFSTIQGAISWILQK